MPLVRRLLENGANTSFVHKLVDPKTPVERLAAHPVREVGKNASFYNTAIAKPGDIFTGRANSNGTNLHIQGQREAFLTRVTGFFDSTYEAASIINGKACPVGDKRPVISPYNHRQISTN